jgi:hypothetical protein
MKSSLYLLIFLMYLALLIPSNSLAAGCQGFRELKGKDCILLGEKDVQRLPTAWFKYKNFIKICPLKNKANSTVNVSIISVWTDDYLNAQVTKMWENFPPTIIVDYDFNELGTLPELFPMGFRTEPIIYYGKWKSGIPTEIRIDVYNPTVSGDYYYSPLTWNDKSKKYDMKDKEAKSGKRPRP